MPDIHAFPARPGLSPEMAEQPEMAIEDVLEAMRGLGGYVDISPADALALYRLAYDHASARLARDVAVAEIMRHDVVVVAPQATALEAARLMAAAGVSGLPVVAGAAVVGVVSVKDLLRLLALPGDATPAALAAWLLDPAACVAPLQNPAPAPALGNTPVSALMTSPAVVVGPQTPRSQAAASLAAHGINRLPVVDGGTLCGIVSRSDVVRSCRGMPGEGR